MPHCRWNASPNGRACTKPPCIGAGGPRTRYWRSRSPNLSRTCSRFPAATTSIAEDLRSIGRSLVDLLTSDVPTVRGAVRALFFDAANVAQVAELKRHLYAQRYQQAESFVSAAIDRGELPGDTDTRELVGLVMAPIYYRKLVTSELDRPPRRRPRRRHRARGDSCRRLPLQPVTLVDVQIRR